MTIIILSLLTAIFLESTIISLPLTLVVLLFAAIYTRDSLIFLLAFLAGIAVDILSLRALGISSLYFVTFVFIIFLYHKKFEAGTLQFLAVFAFLGSILYLIFLGTSQILFHTITTTILVMISFLFYKKSTKAV